MNDVGAIIDFVCIVGAQLSVMKIEYLIGKNTRYSVKRLWAARTFLWSKPQGDGVWIRRYLVYFDFRNHRAEPEFHGRGIWWTDGKTIKQWKRDWGEKAQYIMCQRPKLSAMLLAPSGPYQPYTLASHTDQFESDVRKVLKSEWMYQYDNHLNFPWEVRQWEIVNRYPMAESLVKTGWADALCSQVYDEYEHSTRINLRAETYYGVFGLNRQELAAVSQSKKSFREVDNALEWKEAGLAINGKNMAMTANIRKLSGMAKTLQESGMTRSLKYLRQQTRRATGSYNGRIALQVASDWLDYLDMAGQMKMNLNLEKVRFPLDLKRRHDDLVLERNKRRRKDALRGAASSIKKDAKELENQFHIENIYKKIRKIYEYDGAEYIIRVPDGAKAILEESRFLDHCIQRGTRYFERIAKRESYIFFMRRKADPNTPWYTLEVEPGGTVRQKRSYNNDQYADLEDAKPFIAEWQQVVQGRMTAAEIDFARQSKEIRAQEFAELKENGNIIRTGANAGKLLVDELIHPYKNNPRNNEAAIEPVAQSIKRFGFRVPILIDGKGTIIAGHTRYEAAKRLDMDKVPCIRVDDLTDEQIRAYRIADNKVAEASSWNDDVLRAEMDALKALDVDLTDTGFSEVELDGLLREVEDADFEEFFTEPVQQPPKAADAEQSAETQQSTQPESSQLAVPQQSGSKLIQCPHCGEWFET